MKEIKLTKNQKCIVDDNVFEAFSRYKWYAEGRNGKYYACRRVGNKIVKMHRIILGVDNSKIAVDHVNGNTLDNRSINLRTCTWAQNLRNSALKPSNKSGYKGVCFSKRSNKFRATIVVNYKQIHLGVFDTAIEAAKAYNAAALIHHGEFARINQL